MDRSGELVNANVLLYVSNTDRSYSHFKARGIGGRSHNISFWPCDDAILFMVEKGTSASQKVQPQGSRLGCKPDKIARLSGNSLARLR